MPIGGSNQTNRIGHGIASKSETLMGQVTYAVAGEKTLQTIISSVVSANSRGPGFAPFEIRLISSATGELRSATGVSGFPVSQVVAGSIPAPTVLYLAQNDQTPKDNVYVYLNGPGVLYVTLLG